MRGEVFMVVGNGKMDLSRRFCTRGARVDGTARPMMKEPFSPAPSGV